MWALVEAFFAKFNQCPHGFHFVQPVPTFAHIWMWALVEQMWALVEQMWALMEAKIAKVQPVPTLWALVGWALVEQMWALIGHVGTGWTQPNMSKI